MQLTENYDSYIAASGDEPGAAIFMSVFFIKISFVSVCSKQDVRHPVRGSAHLLTYGFQVNAGIAFDDQFIMNVTDDKAVPERFHGVAENVAADGLDDILHEFRSVGFNAFPLLRRANTFIGDGFSAELIDTDAGLHIRESAA